jgi:NDP-sugar pyrophosphorylase family protein
MSRRAVILAGGMGTRLRPYTVVLPKPLMPLGEFPILEVIVRQLARQRFDHLTLAVNHQAAIIKAFFGDGSRWGVQIDYSLETEPLGTIGPLTMMSDLPDHFVLMNGDILTDLDVAAFLAQHEAGHHLFSIAAAERQQRVDYGVLHVDEANRLSAFDEKPSLSVLVSMGVYAVSKGALAYVPPGVKYGFDDLMLTMLKRKAPVEVVRHAGYWLDIGRPDDYERAIDEFAARKQQFLADA